MRPNKLRISGRKYNFIFVFVKSYLKIYLNP